MAHPVRMAVIGARYGAGIEMIRDDTGLIDESAAVGIVPGIARVIREHDLTAFA